MVDFLEAESTVVSDGPEPAPLFRRTNTGIDGTSPASLRVLPDKSPTLVKPGAEHRPVNILQYPIPLQATLSQTL